MKEKIYFYNGELETGKIITISGDEFHHIANVMRSKIGTKICLINGNGKFYFGEIISIEKKQLSVKITNSELSKNEPKINLTIFQALAKGEKLSLILQKISELGASKFCLFESENTDVKSSTNKLERLESISISASKQCERATITKCEGIYKIQEIAKIIKLYDKFFVAYENDKNLNFVNEILNTNKENKNIAIMIGAEGGFTHSEIDLLKENGAIIVSLGNRILRTETATITCTALAMQIMENNLKENI